jgi:hypothetical protein
MDKELQEVTNRAVDKMVEEHLSRPRIGGDQELRKLRDQAAREMIMEWSKEPTSYEEFETEEAKNSVTVVVEGTASGAMDGTYTVDKSQSAATDPFTALREEHEKNHFGLKNPDCKLVEDHLNRFYKADWEKRMQAQYG